LLGTACIAQAVGIKVVIVNVGTNTIDATLANTNALGGSIPYALLPGQASTNTDGGSTNTHYYVLWTAYAGGPAAYSESLGTGSCNICAPNDAGIIPVAGNGVPTNCTDSMTVCNGGIGSQTYQLLNRGIPSGTLTLAGGQCQTLTFPNPTCAPGGWSYYAIPGYINLGGPGYSSGNPGIGPGDNPIVPINSGTSVNGSNGGGSNNTLDQQPPPPDTNYMSLTNNNTNGPINFGTNQYANPTNNANNGVVQAGDNALYAATTQGDKDIISAIQTLDYHNQQGHNGISNAVLGLNSNLNAINTNLTFQFSNLDSILTNVDTNISTNSIMARADAASAAGQAALQSAGDSLGTITPPTIPDSGSWMITVGSGAMAQTFDINPLSNSSLFPQVAGVTPWVRRLSEWAMTLWFVIWLVGEINSAIRTAFCAPQSMSGDALPVVAEIEGAVIGGIVVFALYVVLTAAIAYLSSTLVSSYLAHPFDGSGPQAVQSGVAWLDAVFDISLCLSLSAQRVSIPFYLTKLVYRAVSVIRFIS